MLRKQESLIPQSPFRELYEVLVPEDHILRKMKDLVDFSFIYEEVKDNYTVDFGRNAADPVYLFKLLLLKNRYPLSDRDLCERARYDMSFKFFLDLAPEEKIIDPSLLSKFRTQRLKKNQLLGLLLWETSRIALLRKARAGKKNQKQNQLMTYYFDIEKCKVYPLDGTCHKPGAKSKTYNVTLKSDLHQKQLAFEQTEEFREKVKLRYRIEQKNSKVKNRHGLKRANGDGLFAMTLQSASVIFIANMKRIIRLIESR